MSYEDLISDVIAAPLGDVVAEIGLGVAKAQYAIDANTIENLKSLYSSDENAAKELRNLGYRPTWYVIPEAKAEVNLALSIGRTRSSDGKETTQLNGTTIDAGYQNQYDFNIEAASKLTLTYMPVPAPQPLDELNVVPELTGMTLGASQVLLDRLGIPYQNKPANAKSNQIITQTHPEAGQLIEKDATLVLVV